MPDPTLPLRYPYRMKLWPGVVLTIMGFGLGGLMLWFALENPEGAEMTQTPAIVWVFTGLMLLLGVAGLYALAAWRRPGADLVVDELGLLVPVRAGSQKTNRVLFAGIQEIGFAAINGVRFIDFHHSDGKARITDSALPEGAFEEVWDAIAPRLPKHLYEEEPLP